MTVRSYLNKNGSLNPADWTYGNYGGPVWTAGTGNGTDFNVAPVNALDNLFRGHDLAYTSSSSTVRGAADAVLRGGITNIFISRKTFSHHPEDVRFAISAIALFTVTQSIHTLLGPVEDLTKSLLPPLIRSIAPLDLDGDGIELSALGMAGQTGASTVFFDFDGDGFKERTGWVKADDGMLALDLNGNGLIDDGSELFGQPVRDGYEVLETYDTFQDGVIDAKDAAFARLCIWRDLDQDGITDAGEMQTLTEAGITSISLTRTDVAGTNQGHDRGFQGGFTRTNGTTGTAETIYFQTNRQNTRVDPTPGFALAVDVKKPLLYSH